MQTTGLDALFSVVTSELEGIPAEQQSNSQPLTAKGHHQPAAANNQARTRVSKRVKRPNERFKDFQLSEDQPDREEPATSRGHPKSRPVLPFVPFGHCPGYLATSASPSNHSSASSESDKSHLNIPLFITNNTAVKPAMESSFGSGAQQNGALAMGSAAGDAATASATVPDMQMNSGLNGGPPFLAPPMPLMAGIPSSSSAMHMSAAGMIPQPMGAGFYNYMLPPGLQAGQGYPGYYPAPPGMMMPQQLPMGVEVKPEECGIGPESLAQLPSARDRSRSPVTGHRDKKPRQSASGFAAKHPGTSTFRGVSWHTQTGRWKAQIKVNGRDINLGRHKDETAAARAYDRAAICARGVEGAKLNFPLEEYQAEVDDLQSTQLDDLAASLRGVEERMQAQTSRYHGVRLNKRTNKWEAYIRVNGKHVHLGCYDHEVAAAQAFDQAAIVRHAYHLSSMGGRPHLVTNFPPDYYQNLLAKQQGDQEAIAGNEQGPEDEVHHQFYKLDEKYVHNLVEKCREQGGQMGQADGAQAEEGAPADEGL